MFSEYKDEEEDVFIERFVELLDKKVFMDESNIIRLKSQFSYRYEIYFLELCRKFIELKKEAYSLNHHKIAICGEKILTLLYEMNTNFTSQVFILSSPDHYIIKPLTLLRLWDSSSEEYDIQSYLELNLLFLVKTYIKSKQLELAFSELEIILTEDSLFDRSQILIYYFGKIVALLCDSYKQIKNGGILSLLEGVENYSRLKKIIKCFGQPSSNNYKKKAKNYLHLVRVAEFFKIDSKR
jgi:hypothetical protein